MKLKNIFKFLAVAGTLALSTTSCSDWLDVKMNDKIMENTLFSTNNGFMIALNGVYMGMIDVYGEDLSLGVIDVMAQYYNMVSGNHNYKYSLITSLMMTHLKISLIIFGRKCMRW